MAIVTSDQSHQFVSKTDRVVGTMFTYDASGNMDTKTGGWDDDWNAENRMTVAKQNSAQVQAYTYDGLGRRAKADGIAGSGAWTVSIVSEMDVIFEKTNTGAVTRYVYANGMRIARITSSGAVQYFLADHQGSTRKILDSARVEQYAVEYEPFGRPYAPSCPQPDPHKYTSEKHDDPTGLVYMRARQYDPDLGRFVSADPILGSLPDPQTLDRYVYVRNNPTRYVDPNGLKGCHPDDLECVFQGEMEAEWWGACGSGGCPGWDSLRAWGDAFFTAVGVVPVLGDVLSTAWFVSWDVVDCATVGCDWTAIGLDLLGIAPFVPNLGGLARMGGRLAGVLPLPFLGGVVRHGDEATRLGGRLPHVISQRGVVRSLLRHADEISGIEVRIGRSRADLILLGKVATEIKTGDVIRFAGANERQMLRHLRDFGRRGLTSEYEFYYVTRVDPAFLQALHELKIPYYSERITL